MWTLGWYNYIIGSNKDSFDTSKINLISNNKFILDVLKT